jgi:hypothetical protein
MKYTHGRNMTESDIIVHFGHSLEGVHDIVMPRYDFGESGYKWEADIFSITHSGITNEFEIKLTRQDYFHDFEKKNFTGKLFSGVKEYTYKHEWIRTGNRTARFWFIVPEGMITLDEVPNYAGLIYANEWQNENMGYEGISFDYVKNAPRLHKRKEADLFYRDLAHKAIARYYKLLKYNYKFIR